MEIKGKQIVVVGLGISGVETARFLKQEGASVIISDKADESSLGKFGVLARRLGVQLETGGHRPETFADADYIIISPGVPHTIGPVKKAQDKGIPILGEIELASRFIDKPIVAVTGTNGKTTTTALLGEMLTRSGVDCHVCGNIGNPLIGYLTDSIRATVIVAEISSFQLDTIDRFKPAVGVLLNITPDHLDRYADLDAYAASKERLFKNQTEHETAVLNRADPLIRNVAARLKSTPCFFYHSSDRYEDRPKQGAEIRPSEIRLHMGDPYGLSGKRGGTPPDVVLNLSRFHLSGKHNLENVSAAALAALSAGGTIQGIQAAINGFKGLPHRLEHIRTVDGVRYFNDSKATNIDAAARALEAFSDPVIMIMGGRDKNQDFTLLKDRLERHAKKLIITGEAEAKIKSALGRIVPTDTAPDMKQAVLIAKKIARPQDIVLLSPGCASFDRYRNYEDRGNHFSAIVKSLP